MNKKPIELHQVPESCPVCSGELYIRDLACPDCDTRIRGAFENRRTPFELDDELLKFLKVFIFAEGSIKQSEKILNCSYPKIKNLLKKTKAALGLTDSPEHRTGNIINDLDSGKIDVDEALQKLKQL